MSLEIDMPQHNSNTSAGPVPQKPHELDHKHHIVVVGAGISGLTSAWFLQQQGFSV
ncbi:MAG TPA: FAD-binding oxidoreductase, partial [Oceanospirillaceae bacterium]|nr:FAD-binding oxidoreductase [Oceanospirillaceae bacterium]